MFPNPTENKRSYPETLGNNIWFLMGFAHKVLMF